MRLSGFILGGIVGIAAAAYMTQKRPGSLAWAGNATGQLVSGMKGRILETALTRKFGSETASQTQQKKSASTGKSEESWATIEHLLNSDPEVKAAASEIIADSSVNQATSSPSQASH